MASKSKRRRKVLGASCILAALIIAGSSFAWFTSKDEVTNRLSASADYGVTIAEDFTPPENWIPGQKVDKNVGVVNTGNVDAFVRTYLQGEMRVVKETSSAVATWDATGKVFKNATDGDTVVGGDSNKLKTNLTSVTDESLKALNLKYSITDDSKTYYLRELTKTKRDNPTPTDPDGDNPDEYSEVMAVQAGGELVYTTGTVFTYKPNQSMTVLAKDNSIQNIVKDTVYTVTISTNANNITVDNGAAAISVADIKYLPSIDTDEFKPATSGLYIFKRNADKNTALSSDDFEYSGYYYAATANTETSTAIGTGVYLALHNGVASSDTDRSDYTLPKEAIDDTYDSSTNTWSYAPTATVQLYTAERTTIDNGTLNWTYTAPVETASSEKQGYLTAATSDDSIKVNVYLTNIKATTGYTPTASGKDNVAWTTASTNAESWTPIAASLPTAPITFYYNNDLEEGCTTARLVDSVELDSSVTKDAYLAFDFDLNVFTESVQVTVDENGAEGVTTVAPWAASPTGYSSNGGAVAATATKTMDTTNTNEIASIAWTYSS